MLWSASVPCSLFVLVFADLFSVLQLLKAAIGGDLELMKQCLNTPGVNVNALIRTRKRHSAEPDYSRTALMAVIRAQRGEWQAACRLLLEAKASPEILDSERVTVPEFQVCVVFC